MKVITMDKVKKLIEIIEESKHIVFFGGAGVSVESGIPDFRSANGLYSEKSIIPVESILSHTFFINHPDKFYDFYKNKMIYLDAKPNPCHMALAYLEKIGKLSCVITQNIDNLHTMAGSKNVYNLHGSIYSNHCVKCNKWFDIDYIINTNGVPKCDECGGIVKPDVVLYEESLDMDVLTKSIEEIEKADTLIIGGTSLTVYPAAGLVRYFNGKNLIIINKSVSNYDNYASLVINENIGEVFEKVMKGLKYGQN